MAGLKLEWDKYAFKIDGKKTFILSGEFHYWRAPDRERWLDLLKTYKILGLNALRIYFHWGYHNPAEDKYYFDGNRDVDYLLKICEELGFYVFIAAGPYICAETNAGGYPGWLLAKRDVYIKNLKATANVKYDPKYMKHCRNWYEHFIPNIKKHQITENPKGCIIGFQIENEYFEKFLFLKGNRKYMEELIKYVREFGVSVPTFHNDAWETGSWNNLVDLYGFDKYPIWAPKKPKIELGKVWWSFKKFEKKVDFAEKKVRSFGGAAAKTPIFIPELQGGWFNHWGIKYGFDELYDFYGSTYQKMLEQSYAAQGITMMSIYMLYGGTSWGSIPDCDVYTSYDYSGTIREYGYQSDRLRHLRLFMLFARCFNDSITSTELVEQPFLTCNQSYIFNRQRKALDGTDYYFFRNFNRKKIKNFKIQLIDGVQIPKSGVHELEPRDAFVAVGNHDLNGFFIIFCSLPILIKGFYTYGVLLVVYQNGGELILKGTDFKIKGDLNAEVDRYFTRFSFPKEGLGCISDSNEKPLYILCLSKQDALTLNADLSGSEIKIAWGAYSIYFNQNNELEIETLGSQTVWLLSSQNKVEGFDEVKNSCVPGLQKGAFGSLIETPEVVLEDWAQLKTNWDAETSEQMWKSIDLKTQRDPIDHHFTCGHVLYKCEFEYSDPKPLKLKINIRFKMAIWLNNQFVGGHNTYSIKFLSAGAKNGPDPTFLGSKTYELTNINREGKNTLFVVTENLGHSRIPFVICDVRNPRGIISAKFSNILRSEKWYISGIDVTKLENAYNTSGLPGELLGLHLGEGTGWQKVDTPTISPEDKIVWYKTSFDWNIKENKRIPLRLHLEGMHNVSIYLNGIHLGKYWGEYGPQHDFYIMDKLLQEHNTLVLACWTTNQDKFSVSVKPYRIVVESGNVDENGTLFATEKRVFSL